MDINRFTEKLQEAIRAAQSKAVRYGHQQIDVEHLLAALLEQEGGLAPSILAKAGRQRRAAGAAAWKRSSTACPRSPGPAAGPTRSTSPQRLNRLLTDAEDEARKLKDEYISVEHVLLAALDDRGAGRQAAARNSASPASG